MNYSKPKSITDVLIFQFAGMTTKTVPFSGGNFVTGQVVAKLNGRFVPLVVTATDDSAKAAAVCLANVDATVGEQSGLAAVRLANLMAEGLVWPDGITDANKAVALAQLEEKFLIVQDPV